MSQTSLFIIGAVVSPISVAGMFWYGYFLINRAGQLDLANEAAAALAQARPVEPAEGASR